MCINKRHFSYLVRRLGLEAFNSVGHKVQTGRGFLRQVAAGRQMGRATMFPALSLGKDREATGGVRTSANEMFGLSKFRMKDTSVKFDMQFGTLKNLLHCHCQN